MKKFDNPAVANVFDAYPKAVRGKMLHLRQLVFDTAVELANVGQVEETLKWGEPSYMVKGGSTVRMDWKESTPTQYALYFHCQTKLVDTFKELYRKQLNCQGNRAIVFDINQKVPDEIVKHCIGLSLTYHSRKKLPLLGV